jgi:hypothetical protein
MANNSENIFKERKKKIVFTACRIVVVELQQRRLYRPLRYYC